MKILLVDYSTYKQIYQKIPLYHIKQANGSYTVAGTSDNFIITCDVIKPSDITDYEAVISSSAKSVSSIDDAIALGVLANKSPLIEPRQKDKATLVAVVGREGSETIWATHNFADKTTWYGDSERITEVLSDSGDNLTFSGSYTSWIDMCHGKVFDEDSLKEDYEHQFDVTVVVNNVTMSMIEPLLEHVSGSPGDYYVNYASGSITFINPVTSSVTCSYSYEHGSTWYLAPYEGKAIDIEQAEIQFSENVGFNDTIVFAVYGYVDVFAPQYLQSNGGPFPSGYKIKLEENRYKAITQMIDEALGSYPIIPAIGGTSNRGMNSSVYGFPFAYKAVRRLDSRAGMELRVSLQHDTAFTGMRATGTFYAVSRNVADLDE